MILTPEQCQELIANGGKITGEDGEEIEFPKDTAPDTGNKALLGIIGQLLGTVKELQSRPAPVPAAPAALAVPAKKKDPAVWNCHVVERDQDKRIKTIRFEEWVKPS